jgi:hypothetical protein
MKSYKILSIDAWHEGHSWSWNNWHTVGHLTSIPDSNRALLKLLRDKGYLTEASKGQVSVEIDEVNAVIVAKGTREPLLAVEMEASEI